MFNLPADSGYARVASGLLSWSQEREFQAQQLEQLHSIARLIFLLLFKGTGTKPPDVEPFEVDHPHRPRAAATADEPVRVATGAEMRQFAALVNG